MSVDELQQNPAYHLLLVLRHDEIIPFVQEHLPGRTAAMKFFWGAHIALLACMTVVAFGDVNSGAMGWGTILRQFAIGFILTLPALIILHEAIHGLTYKLAGAPKVSFGVNWRMFYFYAVAGNYVVSRRQFIFIGLAPFVAVTSAAITALFFTSPPLNWILWGVLLMHTGACAGDFALLGFYEKHRQYPEMLTFDDVENKTSWFYVREEEDLNMQALSNLNGNCSACSETP
jgi:putative zincin peptidase